MSNDRSFAWTASILGLFALAGIGALIWGATQPVYRVLYDVAFDAFLNWCTDEPRVDPVVGEKYLAMFGSRYFWMDLGLGVAATALTGLVILIALSLSRTGDSWVRTPSRRAHFILAGWAVLAWTFVTVIHSLEKDLDRQLFPTCADSISIPLYGAFYTFAALYIACTLVGFLLMLGFGDLPAPLNQWDNERPERSWFMTIVFALLILVVGTAMVMDATNSMSIGNPAGLVAIYLLASTRAALLAPRSLDE